VTANRFQMQDALQDSHKAYERLRRQVRAGAKKPAKAWFADRAMLGGTPRDQELESAIEDHLVTFLLDEFLNTTSKSKKLTQVRLDGLAATFLEHRVRPLLGRTWRRRWRRRRAG
jgi:hypothetical protein